MIISASRRTDIPAFYSQWLMQRVRQGFCWVPNPYNPKQGSTIPLNPNEVDGIVFWSKNPAPLLEHLPELEGRGFTSIFQFTLNAYSPDLEPRVPPLPEKLAAFYGLARRIGPERMIWRYDPIVLSNQTPPSFHEKHFEHLARELSGQTQRVIISLVQYYQKTKRKFAGLEEKGFRFEKHAAASPQTRNLLANLKAIASSAAMEIQICAEPTDFSDLGIGKACCVDGKLISRLTGKTDLSMEKDPGQRPACRCVRSRDIGVADSCLHGCLYCYSTRSDSLAQRRHELHSPQDPWMSKV